MLPLNQYTNEFSSVCNNLIYTYQNINDRKSINCVKFSNYSKKLFAATSGGNILTLDLSNSITFYQKSNVKNKE